MAGIFAFTTGPSDWKAFLADPKHWRTGYSACTLAHSWESANGFPPEVAHAIAASTDPLFRQTMPLLGIPEFKVPLPGGSRPSQNDIFVLAKSDAGPIAIMVEGKVNESFGPTLDEWRVDSSPGKDERLKFLLGKVGFRSMPMGGTRYQLLHRAASAILTGEQYRAAASLMLVHSFSAARAGWTDYECFLKQLGVEAAMGKIQRVPGDGSIPLFVAWVVGDSEFLKS